MSTRPWVASTPTNNHNNAPLAGPFEHETLKHIQSLIPDTCISCHPQHICYSRWREWKLRRKIQPDIQYSEPGKVAHSQRMSVSHWVAPMLPRWRWPCGTHTTGDRHYHTDGTGVRAWRYQRGSTDQCSRLVNTATDAANSTLMRELQKPCRLG